MGSPSVVQEWELALRELSTMEVHLAHYVAPGNSALLEQQLEQLHGQWEELCTKVSAPGRQTGGDGRGEGEMRGKVASVVPWW